MVTLGMASPRTGSALLAVSVFVFTGASSCNGADFSPNSPGAPDNTPPEFLDARATFTSSDGSILEWSLMPDNDGDTNNDEIVVTTFNGAGTLRVVAVAGDADTGIKLADIVPPVPELAELGYQCQPVSDTGGAIEFRQLHILWTGTSLINTPVPKSQLAQLDATFSPGDQLANRNFCPAGTRQHLPEANVAVKVVSDGGTTFSKTLRLSFDDLP
jgi:hypothetical protein